ncbi:MAG: helix-turn-helix transcriptional regulator [Bacillota bacterium]|nr:helix-turn-helix transcriptional regulator [Bacillota bacterium]
MLIRLSEVEKQEYCITLGDHLRKLRAIAGLTQDDLENLCGISKERISRIENGAYIMRWSQFVNLIMIFTMNANTKEYLVAVKILTPRLLQAMQMKDARVPPDIVVPISESLTKEFNDDFKNVNSLTLKAKEIE